MENYWQKFYYKKFLEAENLLQIILEGRHFKNNKYHCRAETVYYKYLCKAETFIIVIFCKAENFTTNISASKNFYYKYFRIFYYLLYVFLQDRWIFYYKAELVSTLISAPEKERYIITQVKDVFFPFSASNKFSYLWLINIQTINSANTFSEQLFNKSVI